ncbi:hypothetical protein [Streptomyces nodosus]|uniref:Uncharacterized protein n=1 Tax=Streptomyces nodosus TaxID=40318 RepID=A0A5P2VWY9_9ACTN|nr:hypothetical protein [Streptomyces nodosus]MBB4790510.1 hypothetical protein [Streptomyces nodosus]QEV38140.1 hypothetical protein CP978_05960 [Streptomyces nodosus]
MLPMVQIRALLREHDDPRHLERPADFDKEPALDCYTRLVSALEEHFGPSCSSGLGQDASFCGVIHVPVDATGLGLPMGVAMSNFGNYFVTAYMRVGVGVPRGEECPPEEFVTWLDGVCTAMGCTFVPTELLREPYDGPVPLAAEDLELAAALVAAGLAEADDNDEELVTPDWHDRYFEYM